MKCVYYTSAHLHVYVGYGQVTQNSPKVSHHLGSLLVERHPWRRNAQLYNRVPDSLYRGCEHNPASNQHGSRAVKQSVPHMHYCVMLHWWLTCLSFVQAKDATHTQVCTLTQLIYSYIRTYTYVRMYECTCNVFATSRTFTVQSNIEPVWT